jgi:anti-sigma regulatory factor (Ser/Thr protein kinase)
MPLARRLLPPDASSVRAARQFVADVLGSTLDTPALQQTVLLVSELATNAVVHARSPFEIVVQSAGDRLRIGVHDRGSGAIPSADVEPPDADAVGGRGLALVSRLAARWGVDPMADGNCVWFELDL